MAAQDLRWISPGAMLDGSEGHPGVETVPTGSADSPSRDAEGVRGGEGNAALPLLALDGHAWPEIAVRHLLGIRLRLGWILFRGRRLRRVGRASRLRACITS